MIVSEVALADVLLFINLIHLLYNAFKNVYLQPGKKKNLNENFFWVKLVTAYFYCLLCLKWN